MDALGLDAGELIDLAILFLDGYTPDNNLVVVHADKQHGCFGIPMHT